MVALAARLLAAVRETRLSAENSHCPSDVGHFVNEKEQTIPGIQNTHTIVTFKAF